MKKWNHVIDVAQCPNCHACTMACHDESLVGAGQPKVSTMLKRLKGTALRP